MIGTVWLFSSKGEPIGRIMACTGSGSTTNAAYGGKDRKSLFIIDSTTGSILRAELTVPGLPLYSHAS